MKRTLFVLYAFITFLIGCKKDFPITNDDAPVFSFKGTINGSAINIKAGNNDYYMYSSYKQDNVTGVYEFIGNLKAINYSNNALKIGIVADTSSSQNAPAQITSSLIISYYTLQGTSGNTTKFDFVFTAQPDATISGPSYVWDFGDGTTSTLGPTMTHTYTHPGYYYVCLTINYANGCSSNICNEVVIGVPNSSSFIADVSAVVAGTNVSFSPIYAGSGNSYLWDFGDGTTSSLKNPVHNYTNTGIYKVCLQVNDLVNNSVANVCRNIATAGYAGCVTNFTVSNPTNNPNPLKYSTAVVSWTNNSGVIYSSDKISQPNDSYFQIISVEDFKANEKGEPTKKLHINFKCNVSDGTTTIPINHGDAVIGVSYK